MTPKAEILHISAFAFHSLICFVHSRLVLKKLFAFSSESKTVFTFQKSLEEERFVSFTSEEGIFRKKTARLSKHPEFCWRFFQIEISESTEE